jgi:hypothetical protein
VSLKVLEGTEDNLEQYQDSLGNEEYKALALQPT